MQCIISLEANLTCANMVGTNNKIYYMIASQSTINLNQLNGDYICSAPFSPFLVPCILTYFLDLCMLLAGSLISIRNLTIYGRKPKVKYVVGSIICRRNSSEQDIYIFAKPFRV